MVSKTAFDKFLEDQMIDPVFAEGFEKAKNEICATDQAINKISGLIYRPNWIDAEAEEFLLQKIQEGNWESSLQRRVQQFGPKYNYTTRKVDAACLDIPDWIKSLNLSDWFEKEPEQIIVNEYEIGQGITKHVDAKVFGPVIASLSLLSDTYLTMGQYRSDEIKIPLERRSLVIMTGKARSDWYHYIAPVKEKRISITFRTIL